MFLKSFYTPGLSINSYLIGDVSSKKAIVIDPTRHVEPYIDCAKKEGLTITHIVETHVHADFISGSKELKHRLNNKPLIYCSAMGGEEWTPNYADQGVKNGDSISLGVIRLEAIHTPGHTPEHIIWLCFDETRSKQVPCFVFTGDFLFVGSIGRPDLLGKTEMDKLAKQLYHSLFVSIVPLPDFLEIYPAHGAGSLCGKGLSARSTSTLGYERLLNPMLVQKPLDIWLASLLMDMPNPPTHFQQIKKINVQGPRLLKEQHQMHNQKHVLVDVRHPDEFAKGHFKSAINIPFGSSFCNWVGSILDVNTSISLIGGSQEQLDEAMGQLQLIGFDDIEKQTVWSHTNKETPIELLSTVDVKKLAETIDVKKDPFYIIDVRTDMEWKGGHIKEANHLELPLIKNHLDRLPKESAIYLICGSGYRASLAASFLKNQAFPNVHNVKGGMVAWHRAGLPVEQD